MSSEIPPQVQNQIAQLQQLQAQLQATGRQRMQLEAMLRDSENALEELEKVGEEHVIYKSVGELMIKSRRDEVKEELAEKKETYELRIKTLERQEERLQKRQQQLQEQVRQALGGGGATSTMTA